MSTLQCPSAAVVSAAIGSSYNGPGYGGTGYDPSDGLFTCAYQTPAISDDIGLSVVKAAGDTFSDDVSSASGTLFNSPPVRSDLGGIGDAAVYLRGATAYDSSTPLSLLLVKEGTGYLSVASSVATESEIERLARVMIGLYY